MVANVLIITVFSQKRQAINVTDQVFMKPIPGSRIYSEVTLLVSDYDITITGIGRESNATGPV